MAEARDDETGTSERKPETSRDARLARQAEALRANLKRRKAQSRGRSDKPEGGPAAAD